MILGLESEAFATYGVAYHTSKSPNFNFSSKIASFGGTLVSP